ncbi:MAG: AmmeMemoRadiSam system radical SAM enzyme [Deltaproteobacteria bacterium]|nr:AmmeMemoRadiSam system radical SAM enzyme [Deltaproteobacteria bacterium]
MKRYLGISSYSAAWMTRRDVLRAGAAGCLMFTPLERAAAQIFQVNKNEKSVSNNDAPKTLWKWSKEVYFKRRLSRDVVQCLTCPNQCVLPPEARSRCGSHVNKGGRLYTLSYGNPCAVHIDPVEKKPLYHFYPGSSTLSVATTGCSFNCLNCQNWEISQAKPEEVRFQDLSPNEAAEDALKEHCRALAYTYTEATTFYEYMIDTAEIARTRGIKNVWITNGYINKEPLDRLANLLDGANVDLKSFSESTYARLNAGRLAPVLETLTTLKKRGVWIEITLLMIPSHTDSIDMVTDISAWILDNLGPDVPLHISRFYPRYKLTRLPPTPINLLREARSAAMNRGIRYVYIGNIPPDEASHTYCPSCKARIIERTGYTVANFHIEGNRCIHCRFPIAGCWK